MSLAPIGCGIIIFQELRLKKQIRQGKSKRFGVWGNFHPHYMHDPSNECIDPMFIFGVLSLHYTPVGCEAGGLLMFEMASRDVEMGIRR